MRKLVYKEMVGNWAIDTADTLAETKDWMIAPTAVLIPYKPDNSKAEAEYEKHREELNAHRVGRIDRKAIRFKAVLA